MSDGDTELQAAFFGGGWPITPVSAVRMHH